MFRPAIDETVANMHAAQQDASTKTKTGDIDLAKVVSKLTVAGELLPPMTRRTEQILKRGQRSHFVVFAGDNCDRSGSLFLVTASASAMI